VRIHEDRFFARVLSGGNLGLGEASMDGDWEMEEGDQEDPLTPLVRNRIDRKVKGGRTDRR
jgi:cyclopropane-fatty-acyl-phospholipid synthase